MVDKDTDSGYNIRTGYEEVDYTSITNNKSFSEITHRDLLKVSAVLRKLKQSYDVKPVIAGGSIRDLLLGYSYPKDFDIFIDVSAIEDPDELQDFFDGFTYDFAVGVAGNITVEGVSSWPYTIEPMIGDRTLPQYKDMDGTFKVMEWYSVTLEATGACQFIFMKNPEISEDPAAWIKKKFDYSLVRCFMDVDTDKVYASDDFMKDRKNTTIHVTEDSAAKRINKWANREGLNIRPILVKDLNETEHKAKSPSVSKVYQQRWLQHPKKWVG